jgi:hypothetical protein
MPRVKPIYQWDTKSARYRRSDNGFYIRRREVNRLFQDFILTGERRAAELADKLLARETLLFDWQSQMVTEIRHAHTIAAVTARGGWSQMTPADWGRLGAMTRAEYGYLNVLARDIEIGARAFNGHVRASARRYIRASRSTYFNTQHRVLLDHQATMPGILLARRVYGASITNEKCDGCQREHDRGWSRADSIAEIGTQECGHNCNCYMIYKTVRSLTDVDLTLGTFTDDDD